MLGVNGRFMIWSPSLCYRQDNPQFCPFYNIRLQRGVKFWLLRHWVWYSNPFCFCAELLSLTTHSSILWNSLRLKIGVNCWLSRQLLSTDWPNPDQFSTPQFCAGSSSGTTHSSLCGIGLDFTMVSITDFWHSYYQPNTPSIFHPLFLCGIIISHHPHFCPLKNYQSSESCQLLIVDTVIIERPNPWLISHPLFLRGIIIRHSTQVWPLE